MEPVFDTLIETVAGNPILLLFLIAAVGYPLGKARFFGASLGVASVLFVGLFFGALDPRVKLPPFVYEFGLALFIYTVGLASGPAFVASMRREGIKDNALALATLGAGFAAVIWLADLASLSPTLRAGLFAGALTNTPALAGVLETLGVAGVAESVLAEPVVAYSICYPMGVMGGILALMAGERIFKIDYAVENAKIPGLAGADGPIEAVGVRVTDKAATETTVDDLFRTHRWKAVFGRFMRDGVTDVVRGDMRLMIGDLVVVVGTPKAVTKVVAALGERGDDHIEWDVSAIDMRRIFVSNPAVTGKKLRDLSLDQQFGAVVSRLRRGDADMVVDGDTRLMPGDRVRVVARRTRMPDVTRFFGDSYRQVSEIDILTFSLGLSFGLLLGVIPIPLGDALTVKLGFAGGPLIAGLFLGAMGRTGGMVWALPYGANMTLRQMGLILFLAGIGARAGGGFVTTFMNGGVWLFLLGGIVTFTAALTAIAVGKVILRIPYGALAGMVAGLHTQPAVLGFAQERAGDEAPAVGYAAVFPTATLLKILLAQLLLSQAW
jgi:putative transport protein